MSRLRAGGSWLLLALAITISACAPSDGSPIAGATPSATNAGHAPGTQDIPDTQLFLTYKGAGFAMEYPEGWTQTVTSDGVVFSSLDSRISVSVRTGSPPDVAAATAEAQAMPGAPVTTPPQRVTLPAGPAVAFRFQSNGSPDPVTGKSVVLSTDRYEIAGAAAHGGFAVIDLSSPAGVDNIDAFRRIALSFAWR